MYWRREENSDGTTRIWSNSRSVVLEEKKAHQRHAIPCRRSKDKAKKRANKAQLVKSKDPFNRRNSREKKGGKGREKRTK
jgi:hypothetical protein